MKARHKAQRLGLYQVSALHVVDNGGDSAELSVHHYLIATPIGPSITHMKRFLKKIRRGKLPKPPEQPIPLKNSTSIAAGPPDTRAEPDVTPDGERSSSSRQDLDGDYTNLTVPSGEGGGRNSRILPEDGMDANQRLPVSGTSTSCMVISGTDYRNQPTSQCSDHCDGPDIPHADLCFLPSREC